MLNLGLAAIPFLKEWAIVDHVTLSKTEMKMNINPQILYGADGEATGVYLTMEEWAKVKANMETLETAIPKWVQEESERRLDAYLKGETKSQPAGQFLQSLHEKLGKAPR